MTMLEALTRNLGLHEGASPQEVLDGLQRRLAGDGGELARIIAALGLPPDSKLKTVLETIQRLLHAADENQPRWPAGAPEGGRRQKLTTSSDPRWELVERYPGVPLAERMTRARREHPGLAARVAEWYHLGGAPAPGDPQKKWGLELSEAAGDARERLVEKAREIVNDKGVTFGEALQVARAQDRTLADKVDEIYR